MPYIQKPADLFGLAPDGSAQRLICDSLGNLSTVETAHYRIHNGQTYVAGKLWGESTSPIELIADNASAEILIQAGEGMHMIADVAAGGDCEIEFCESVTFSDAGTAVTAFNKNRYSTNTSLSTITHTPTITDYGTSIFKSFLPGGAGGNAIGGTDGGFGREMILKSGLDYVIKATNRRGQASHVSIMIEWYKTT